VVDKHFNSLKRVICSSTPSYPTKVNLAASVAHSDNGDNTNIITSDKLCKENHDSHHAFGMLVGPSLTITDTGTTSFFLTKGANMSKQATSREPHHHQAMRWPQNQVNTHVRHCNSWAAYSTYRTYHD
jgi:hypothetical protein